MFSPNALKVLEKRYFLRDENGKIVEDVQALCHRVALAVAGSERRLGLPDKAVQELASRYEKLMLSRQFFPNSPTLMNAGRPGGQLSACFVLPVPDNLEGIFETCKNAALIHKTGGGTGFSFSRLRPANDRVASSVGVASGPVSFMKVYDAATEAIRQGGTRRGANMGMLRVDHPDIEEFIECKRDTTRLNNFNISVAVTDDFMEAVREGSDFALLHPTALARGEKQVVREISARALFEKIVENAHSTGEPGIIFIDRINRLDPVGQALDDSGRPIAGTEEIEATNPCGEQPLGPGDACNLGSINLALFVDSLKNDFDYERLAETIKLSVRFLDDVIDANCYPFEFVARATLNNRRIGLGVMGFAEALILMGLAYDSEAALVKASQLMSFFQETAHQASRELAASRGNFPNWPYSIWAEQGLPQRNATVTTIAPTGTISILAGTTSGIEPLFAVSYVRRVMGGTELVEVNPLFEKTAKERGFYSEALMRTIAERGSVHGLLEVPQDVQRLFVSAHDVHFSYHVRMQAAFQAHCDNAVSKTINFPAQATIGEVRDAYLLAWESGLKGITVYRDTSRESQVLNIAATDPLRKNNAPEVSEPLKKTVSAGRAASATEVPEAMGAITSFAVSTLVLSERYANDSGCPQCGAQSKSFLKYEACHLCVGCGYTKC